MSRPKISHMILDWIRDQEVAGFKPKELTLSPWDFQSLRSEFSTIPDVPLLRNDGNYQIFGISIITTR